MSVRSPPAVLWLCLVSVACDGAEGKGSSVQTPADAVSCSDSGWSARQHDSLFAVAQDVYFSGEYDSAVVLLTRLHERARQEGAFPTQAKTLTWIGLAYWRLGDYRTAEGISEEALAFKLEHQLVDQYARSYNALGLVAWSENRFSDAARYFERAIATAEEVGNRLRAATAQSNLALVQTELGEFELARSGFVAQRILTAELGETRLEANALTNLGMLEIRLGNSARAIPFLQEALDLYQTIDYGTGVQSALGQLGAAYTELGDPQQAFRMLDSALMIATEQGLEHERASILEAIAEQYRAAGDFPRALQYYASAKEINAAVGADLETGVDLRGEADIHVRLTDLARARELGEEALAIHRLVDAPMEVLLDLLALADIHDRLNQRSAVERRLSEARRVAHKLGSRIARVEVGLTEARIAGRHRRSQDVLTAIRKIEPDLSRGGYAVEWEARLLESRALERMGQIREAAVAGRRALATVERVRGGFGSGTLRTAFVANKREVYAHLISVLLRLGEVDEAFAVADAARGRTLLEGMAVQTARERSLRGPSLTQGHALLAEIDQLVTSIDFAEQTPPSELTTEQIGELEQLYERLAKARNAYEGFLVHAAEIDRGRAAFVGVGQTDVTAVQTALGPNRLLVEYFVPPEGPVLIFAASRDDIDVLESPVTARNLASRVRLARELIVENDGPAERRDVVLASLYDGLIRPLLRAGITGAVEELIVVPHQILAYLPFAALRDTTTDRFLTEDFTLRVLPSAAALPMLAGRSLDPRPDGRVSAFAPFPDRLPATRLEVQAVATRGRQGRRYVGAKATERSLRRALNEVAAVHVATHGIMNAQNPMFSRIELARKNGKNGAPPDDDGRLEVHEVLSLTIGSSLVFLSGCETGMGAAHSTTFAPGEDYTTLAQAFLHAGSEAVIATLWPVEDAGAAAFAELFYSELDTQSPAMALANAQRAMMTGEAYRSPYYWASYQLAGQSPRDSGAHAGADIRAMKQAAIQSTPATLPAGAKSRRQP